MVIHSQKAPDAPSCCLHPGKACKELPDVHSQERGSESRGIRTQHVKLPMAGEKKQDFSFEGKEINGCLKRGAQWPTLTHVKEIHLRAIGLEMEISMDGSKDEERVRDSQDGHQSLATKL